MPVMVIVPSRPRHNVGSQRIVFMEEIYHCPVCNRLVCRVTRGNGTKDHLGCICEDTELFYFDLSTEMGDPEENV